ncbi:MAG: B12-binding domain-containing radical SAM protein [Proteobacteria bacterium]|nr:B12-binding domain-containing radical SAM protein [Pseudomonadota bacterium]
MPFKAGFAPISLATIAALSPPQIEIDIWDENVSGEIDDTVAQESYDLVGLTGFYLHLPRAVKIANIFQKRGIPSALGGPGVSSEPEAYRNLFNHIFIGEAEYTWPQFIRDFQAGRAQPEYRQIAKPDLADVPIPRWDLVPNIATDYAMALVQTTRGCPFDCEFCDVVYLFGRKPRHKPIENVLEEIVQLERMGERRIFLCDDNFIARPSYTKELLRRFIPVNNSFRRPLTFITQLSLNVAKDEELLKLLADANFWMVLIGIESANPESLHEAGKSQNYRTDMLQDIHKIQSHGIDVYGSMVVGFDHDGPEVFDNTYKFIQDSAIPFLQLACLRAYPGTKLWSRLLKEERILLRESSQVDSIELGSNITYKNMSRAELFQGYIDLCKRISTFESAGKRIENMMRQVKRQPRVPVRPLVVFWEEHRLILKMIKFFLFTRDRKLRHFFLNSLRATFKQAPFMLDRVVRLMLRLLAYQDFIVQLEPHYKALIEVEKNSPLHQVIGGDEWATLPESFQKEYKKLFPTVYRRVYERINDKNHLTDALVEIFTTFIERFCKEYDRLGEQRLVYLQETCDRSIARFNQEDPTISVSVEAPSVQLVDRITDKQEKLQIDKVLCDIRRLNLDNEVFKEVKRELHIKVMPDTTYR